MSSELQQREHAKTTGSSSRWGPRIRASPADAVMSEPGGRTPPTDGRGNNPPNRKRSSPLPSPHASASSAAMEERSFGRAASAIHNDSHSMSRNGHGINSHPSDPSFDGRPDASSSSSSAPPHAQHSNKSGGSGDQNPSDASHANASRKRSSPSPTTTTPPPSTAAASSSSLPSSSSTSPPPSDKATDMGAEVPETEYMTEFRLLEEVEWGPRQDEEGYDSDQTLAPRPKNRVTADICDCHMPPPGEQFTCRTDGCINYTCREECRKSHCVEQCGNQRISRREFKKVQVINAGPKGSGLRVMEDCVKGDIIQEYIGQAVREGALMKLFRRYQNERRLYIMALDDKVYLDAKKAGGLARYINHSCNPNCKVEKWRVRGVFRAAVVALCEIKSGTELTFDYQWGRKIGRAPTKCYCGEANCRGTLETNKSLEQGQLAQLLSGNWVSPKHRRADERLVNRTIRISRKGAPDGDDRNQSQTYHYVGEVTEYNNSTKLHKVFHQDCTETWEDLNSGMEWMILEEEQSPTRSHAIARKSPGTPAGTDTPHSSTKPSSEKRAGAGSLLTAFSSAAEKGLDQQYFYLFIQTPIKVAMFQQGNSLKERVERNCRVCITLQQQARPPLPCNDNDPEDVAKYKALDQSLDGTVWKVSIAGSDEDVAKAHGTLSKNVQYWQKKQQDEQAKPTTPRGAPATSAFAHAGKANNEASSNCTDEVIFPRSIADQVKRRLPLLRERCRNVHVQVVPSESKSKQIARLVLEGNLLADLQNARSHVRHLVLTVCKEAPDPPPMVSIGTSGNNKIPRDFGFLGGSLSKQEFDSLLHSSRKVLGGNNPSNNNSSREAFDPAGALIRSKQHGLSTAGLDLNQSPFFTTFESLYGPVWVQLDDDMGRISGHQLVGDANSTNTRKVYFGCDPKDLTARWDVIHKRAQEVMRGIRFLYLGTDQIYQRFLVQSQFFNYVEATTGTSIAVDIVTGNHLRIDGTAKSISRGQLSDRVSAMTDVERANLAEELVSLQIEVYRDQFTRKHSWVFGRDWTTVSLSNEQPVSDNMKQVAASFGKLDIRSAPHSCVEMAEVVANLDLPPSVAAHAAVILYRYVSVAADTQIKARDALLACIFIANKAQKAKKWRKLESVLEAGYNTFYPGTHFDAEKEEVVKLEQRVIVAEQGILAALHYDVFVRDMDSLEQTVSQKGRFVDSIFSFAFSGPVLGAGAWVWLKYGIDYIFAASAAVLKADLKEIVTSLGLIPLKVSATVKLIAENARYGKPNSDKAASNPLLEGDSSRLEKHIPRVNEACVALTAVVANAQSAAVSSARRRCLEIGRTNLRCYVIRGVPQQVVVDHVLPQIDGIEAESGCSIFLSPSQTVGDEDVTIQGPWRAVAIADSLLRSSGELVHLPVAEDATNGANASTQLQVKTSAGLIDARDICTSSGWEGTLHPLGSKEQAERQLGGKSCMPGKISVSSLRNSGLRWWIPQARGSSPTGTFTEMLPIRCGAGDKLEELADMAASMDDMAAFPVLSRFRKKPKTDASNDTNDGGECIAVSLQRWPSEKVSSKEEKRSKKSKRKAMPIGFSAGALQEMQLLTVLHKLIPSPHGHPNFVLPVGVAIPEGEETDESSPHPDGEDPMYSLFKSTQENERAAMKEKKVKSVPHLVFQPCPFVLQRFLSRKKSDVDLLDAPAVMSAWFHDLVSALVHCHSNHVILRTLQPDQVILDHSGVAKLSGLYRATLLGLDERRHPPNIVNLVRELKKQKGGKKKDEEDDSSISPFAPPEILLGSPRFTKESDVWTLGCLLANILLSKNPFVGKDRHSLLTSMYKIVGIPGPKNFEDAARFPHYSKPTKKYKRGVEKAMEHMLKGDNASKYSKAVDLVASMLYLDPSERCTAEEALNHEFLREHRHNIEKPEYREVYTREWTALKQKIVSCYKHADSGRSEQRRALLLASAATGADSKDDVGDGLYDFEL